MKIYFICSVRSVTKIIFLGTGGGRHTTMFQIRSTGGFIIETGKSRIHIDPGPGALTNLRNIGYDVRKIDAIIISHCHPDHCSDAEVLIEGMTHGGLVKRGELYGSVTVIEGLYNLGPAVSLYHKNLPEKCFTVKPGETYVTSDLKMDITKSNHSDPTSVGFKFYTADGILSYVSDTNYSEEIASQYKGTRVLLLPVTVPSNNRVSGHLCTDDATLFVECVKPELCVFIHLGIAILKRDPAKEAAMVRNVTGVRTVAGEDLMVLDMNKNLVFGRLKPMKLKWNNIWNL
ncbi:MAG: MBL fold metallo-hydrolase [archaeon]|nr:MBL fold metallo-hydrolase [archaeon]